MGEIQKLSTLDETQVNQAVGVFVEGFYNIFSSISKDKAKLHKLFKASFNSNMVYVYVQDGAAVGFLGVRTAGDCPVKLNREVFLETIRGFIGKVTFKVARAAMDAYNNANPVEAGGVFIDYLAIDPAYRGKGIGTKLIEYTRENLCQTYAMLDVLSYNKGAKKLYERMGFRVVRVRTNLIQILQGLGKTITMRLDVAP